MACKLLILRSSKSISDRLLEVVRAYRGGTFRAVYTVRLANAVYVLHVFQKKSKSGIETPQSDMQLVRQRLQEAERMAKERK